MCQIFSFFSQVVEQATQKLSSLTDILLNLPVSQNTAFAAFLAAISVVHFLESFNAHRSRFQCHTLCPSLV